MDHIEIKSCQRSAMQDCTNSTDNYEIHSMAAKGFQDSQIINDWLCHLVASEEIARIAGGLAGALRA
jgi:hypothetical protein